MSKFNLKLIGWSGDYYSPLHYVAVLELEGKPLQVGVVRDGEKNGIRCNFLFSCGNRAVPLLTKIMGEKGVQKLADNLAKINEANLPYYDPFRQLPNEWTEEEVRAYESTI